MDIRQLRYFATIAEEGQITGAARRLHIAQPPLSQQLKLLEDELGVQLVQRGSRKIRLTEAGRALYTRAQQILDLVETTAKEIKAFDGVAKGTLSIGTVASLGATLLPERIQEYHNQYPDVDYLLFEGESDRIIELLNYGVIEIGMVRSPVDTDSFESIVLPQEPFVAAMTSRWREGNTEALDISDLAEKPLLIHRRHEQMILKSARKAGFEPTILCRADDIRSMLAWAGAGIGIALATASAARLVQAPHLRYFPLAAPDLTTTAVIIWMRKRYLSVAAHSFLKFFLNV